VCKNLIGLFVFCVYILPKCVCVCVCVLYIFVEMNINVFANLCLVLYRALIFVICIEALRLNFSTQILNEQENESNQLFVLKIFYYLREMCL
jgi:hypothetical protein